MNATSLSRTRWAAIGAVVAITLGAGGINLARATIGTGERTSFVAITPCRLADTRPAPDTVGSRNTPIGSDDTFTLTAHGANGLCTTPIPTGATALSLNVTAIGPTAPTFLTIFPTGATLPTTSNLNPSPGQPPVPNAVTVDINASGQFNIFNKYGSVNVIVDIVGYYEDHNHNDLYYTKAETYTKAEVDAMVSPLTNSVAAYAGGNQFVALTTTDTVYRTVSILPPANGKVIVNSGAYIRQVGATAFIARCSITQTIAVDFESLQYVTLNVGDGGSEVIGGTRGYDVTEGVMFTVNLVCDEASGEANLSDSWLTAIFAPS